MSSRSKNSCAATAVEGRIFVALLKAADVVGQQAAQLLKSAALTGAQYNVLRILRGAEPGGLPCRAIGAAMISRDPDITRLLDRMEKRGLVTRERQTDDRRVVKTQVTLEGLRILKTLDQPVHELHQQQFQHMAAARLKQLEELLDEVRAKNSE
jgi:DNA-binding MarR family transcriptional regulator